MLKEVKQLSTLEVEGQSFLLSCSQKKLGSHQLFHLLSNASIFPKIYWSHKEEAKTYIALGSLLELNHLPTIKTVQVHEGPPLKPSFFGALSFHYKTREKAWFKTFPRIYFILPRYLIEESEEGIFLKSFALAKEPPQELPSFLEYPSLNEKPSLILDRKDAPLEKDWRAGIDRLLRLFKTSPIEKLVLARKTDFSLDAPLDPYLLLEFLKKTQKNCSLFSFQLKADQVFLGATPESLFTRKENQITTEAIAGTTSWAQEMDLMKSPKDLNEFTFVTDYLTRSLNALCKTVEQKKPRELSTGYLRHLYSHYLGNLKEGISDQIILDTLHPTPAICGTPFKLATSLLDELEPFERGWYSAPLGRVSEDIAQFLVGIRSCVVEKNHLTLFAGCGIVTGSKPKQEWDELEAKISPYLQYLKRYEGMPSFR